MSQVVIPVAQSLTRTKENHTSQKHPTKGVATIELYLLCCPKERRTSRIYRLSCRSTLIFLHVSTNRIDCDSGSHSDLQQQPQQPRDWATYVLGLAWGAPQQLLPLTSKYSPGSSPSHTAPIHSAHETLLLSGGEDAPIFCWKPLTESGVASPPPENPARSPHTTQHS